MATAPNNQYQPPESWEVFESLIRDIYREKWQDPDARLNGRKGQEQCGVDVYGHDNRLCKNTNFTGVQCKEKQSYPRKRITINEIKSETEKAAHFKPKLEKFIIATTDRRDAKLEAKVRTFNQNQSKLSKLQVSMYYWEDIVEDAKKSKTIVERYFGTQYAADDVAASSIMQTINAAQKDIRELNIDRGARSLERLKSNNWSLMNGSQKSELLTNLGVAENIRGNSSEAKGLFKESYIHDESNENAEANWAWSLIDDKQYSEAKLLIAVLISKHPNSAIGYSNLLKLDPSTSLKVALGKVPKHLQDKQEISLTLGDIAFKTKQYGKARLYYDHVIRITDRPIFKIHALTMKAEILFEKANIRSVIALRQSAHSKRVKLSNSARLMQTAWDVVRPTETAIYMCDLASRLAHLYKILNQPKRAKDLAIEVLGLQPDNLDANILMGLLERDNDQLKEAARYFTKASKNKDIGALLLLAEVQRDLNQNDDALNTMKKLAKEAKNTSQRREITAAIAEVYIRTNEIKLAEKVVNDYLSETPTDVMMLIQKAHLRLAQDDKPGSIEVLTNIDVNALDVTNDDRIMLADELYRSKHYQAALDIYKVAVDQTTNSEWTRRLLECSYNAGHYKSALELAISLKDKYGTTPFIAEIESRVYEMQDEIDKAIFACNELLEFDPDNITTRIRLAVLNHKLKNFEAVDQILVDNIPVDRLSESEIYTLVNLSVQREMPKISRELLYQYSQLHPNDPNAHARYIGYFFTTNTEDPDLHPTTVGSNTIVTVTGNFGDESYLLYDGPTNAFDHKLNILDPLAEKLLGKKVGDEIALHNTSSQLVKIKQIQSKYISALHQSQELFSSFFPQDTGLQKFHFDPDNPEPAIDQIKNLVTARHKQVESVEKLYSEGKLPLGSFASLINQPEIEVIMGLESKKYYKSINTFRGSFADLETISKSLDGKQLILDLTAALTLSSLACKEAILSHTGKPGITRALIEEIENHVSKLRLTRSEGISTMSSSGNKILMAEISPELVAAQILNEEGVLNFLTRECEIVTIPQILDVGDKRLNELYNLIGKQSVHAILAASDNKILFSEDSATRLLAISEFKTNVTWMQPLLLNLKNADLLSSTEYHQELIELIIKGHSYVSFDEQTILLAAAQSNWKVEAPLRSFLDMLSDTDIDPIPLVKIFSSFLYELWKNSHQTVSHRNTLIAYLVSSIIRRTDSQTFMRLLFTAIDHRFALWYLGAIDAKNSLQTAYNATT